MVNRTKRGRGQIHVIPFLQKQTQAV